ncbi:hypothetical protein XENOCAPTIV_026558 [Xenoophorus captivus]|uniref:Uncharacterized protein n=1 Tax=Xenoophorus captivus TaxID=1517983 RepID=A0ABV0QLE6_9TELE
MCRSSAFSTSLECEQLWYLLQSEAREEMAAPDDHLGLVGEFLSFFFPLESILQSKYLNSSVLYCVMDVRFCMYDSVAFSNHLIAALIKYLCLTAEAYTP